MSVTALCIAAVFGSATAGFVFVSYVCGAVERRAVIARRITEIAEGNGHRLSDVYQAEAIRVSHYSRETGR